MSEKRFKVIDDDYVTILKDYYEELIKSFEKKYGKNIEDVIDDEC